MSLLQFTMSLILSTFTMLEPNLFALRCSERIQPCVDYLSKWPQQREADRERKKETEEEGGEPLPPGEHIGMRPAHHKTEAILHMHIHWHWTRKGLEHSEQQQEMNSICTHTLRSRKKSDKNYLPNWTKSKNWNKYIYTLQDCLTFWDPNTEYQCSISFCT